MTQGKKYRSLSELRALLPDASQAVPQTSTPGMKGLPGHDGKGKAIRILLDTKGRKGKVVTLVIGLQHNPKTLGDLAGSLKRHCGAGGTVREGTIEIQGDQRGRAAELLRQLNYRVTVAG